MRILLFDACTRTIVSDRPSRETKWFKQSENRFSVPVRGNCTGAGKTGFFVLCWFAVPVGAPTGDGVTGAGGDYKLCWSVKGSGCSYYK